MRRGRQVGSRGIELPEDQHIGEIEEEGYQYFGILWLEQTLNTKKLLLLTVNYCVIKAILIGRIFFMFTDVIKPLEKLVNRPPLCLSLA